jgi:hypothetical protein
MVADISFNFNLTGFATVTLELRLADTGFNFKVLAGFGDSGCVPG